ncbi:DUF6362 family protein [Labrenzia sp. 011]|uniref:DUF6362 family protein n=1 Tax=Labrenzia sp. 011 TaxID=2171494 RepID=UPI000D5143E6|nr:DUF6362 family protein [Labrenzia sp. 011]PVB59339.1 hypothetical protein DCO57_22880 [Labrenzia sp. 011]
MKAETPEDIMARLTEAVEVIAATGKGDGPRGILAAWPGCKGRIARRRRFFSPAQVSRAEEALGWFFLIEDADARRALQFEVMCKAGGGKFSALCRKYGWKRSTVTSRNRVVLKKLAERL